MSFYPFIRHLYLFIYLSIYLSIHVSSVAGAPHYLVLDTNVVLEQVDLLESEGINNVIILHTGGHNGLAETRDYCTLVLQQNAIC